MVGASSGAPQSESILNNPVVIGVIAGGVAVGATGTIYFVFVVFYFKIIFLKGAKIVYFVVHLAPLLLEPLFRLQTRKHKKTSRTTQSKKHQYAPTIIEETPSVPAFSEPKSPSIPATKQAIS